MGMNYLYVIRRMSLSIYFSININSNFPPSRVGEYISGICLGYIICSVRDKIGSSLASGIFSIAEIMSLIICIYVWKRPPKCEVN